MVMCDRITITHHHKHSSVCMIVIVVLCLIIAPININTPLTHEQDLLSKRHHNYTLASTLVGKVCFFLCWAIKQQQSNALNCHSHL